MESKREVLYCSVFTYSISGLPAPGCGPSATFPLNYRVRSCMHALWLMGLPVWFQFSEHHFSSRLHAPWWSLPFLSKDRHKNFSGTVATLNDENPALDLSDNLHLNIFTTDSNFLLRWPSWNFHLRQDEKGVRMFLFLFSPFLPPLHHLPVPLPSHPCSLLKFHLIEVVGGEGRQGERDKSTVVTGILQSYLYQ